VNETDVPGVGGYLGSTAAGAVVGALAAGSAWLVFRLAHGCLAPGEVCGPVPLNTAIMAGVGGVLLPLVIGTIAASLLRVPLPFLVATLGVVSVCVFLWVPTLVRRLDDAWPWIVGMAGILYGAIAALCVPGTSKWARLAGLAVLLVGVAYVAIPQ
jgi:hypothetical protein